MTRQAVLDAIEAWGALVEAADLSTDSTRTQREIDAAWARVELTLTAALTAAQEAERAATEQEWKLARIEEMDTV